MDAARISDLLAPFLEARLSPLALEQISTYLDLLLRWNARINLTAIREPEEIVTRHFGESFFLARHLFLRPAERGPAEFDPWSHSSVSQLLPTDRVLDIGSGAGFPALALKIWAPEIRLTLIESNHKKAAFLREVARALAWTDISVVASRAEAVAANAPGSADVVTLRAVERFEQILLTAIKLLAPKARLALLIGSSQLPTLYSLASTLTWGPPFPLPNSQSRLMAIGVLK